MKLKIGVIFGGRSGEHEISIRSAKTVIEQIDKDKYDVVPIAITKEGNWLNPVEALKLFPAATQKTSGWRRKKISERRYCARRRYKI